MKKALVLSLFATTALMVCACGEYTQNVGCNAGEVKCISDENVCYTCDQNGNYWKIEECEFEVNHEKNGCNKAPTKCNALCIEMIDGFKYDVDNVIADGKKRCNSNGTCFCPKECVYGCEPDGSCKNSKCKEGVKNLKNGACECENCIYGCNEDGTCINIECINDNNNNPDGTCECSEQCPNNCNADGSCKCDESKCKYGCNIDGSCNKYACIVGVTNKEDGSCNCLSNCPDRCNPDGLCFVDFNGNHVNDSREIELLGSDTLFAKPGPCRTDIDCKSDPDYTNVNEVFCDSFMDYRCSVKCQDDSDCMSGYICRKDGRCASKYFTTVWSPALREKLYKNDIPMKIVTTNDNCDDLKIYWDWNDGQDNIADNDITCDVVDDSFGKMQGGNKYKVITKNYPKGNGVPNEGKNLVIKIEGELNGFSVYRDNTGESNNFNIFKTVNDNKVIVEENYLYDLIEVQSFGQVGLDRNAFVHCVNLKSISSDDIPDSTKLSKVSRMFKNNCSLDIHDKQDKRLNRWDVSNVTDMDGLFRMSDCSAKEIKEQFKINGSSFNAFLNDWNVSKVKNMYYMFWGASAFNQDIGSWNVSNVKDMSAMFYDAHAFNQDITSWNVSGVTAMGNMFNGALTFNQKIGSWKVSSVTNMNNMFANTSLFNQDIGGWDVSNVINMASMFANAKVFNQNIGSWTVSNVTTMENMFNGAERFNQNLSNWKLETIVNAVSMLSGSGIAKSETNTCNVYKILEHLKDNYNLLTNCGDDKLQQCDFDRDYKKYDGDLLKYLGVTTNYKCE